MRVSGGFNPFMHGLKKIILILLILGLCVGCDRATKVVARKYLAATPPISYLADTFRLQYAENKGAFLSLGARLPESVGFWLLIALPGLFLAGILVYLFAISTLRTGQVVAFSLILGGGLGNLYDRIFNNGYVIDFMNMGIGFVRTGIFNVADVVIMAGFGLLLIDYYGFEKN
jgi:signal peptidase II